MTEISAGASSATVERFDHTSTEHLAALTTMQRDYLLEELDRIGIHAPGIPAAFWLQTLLVRVGDTIAGFCSVDTTRYAIELIYVRPPYRGHGIAARLLSELAATCPEPMRLKTPLSPGGHALAEKLGLGLSHSTDEEQQTADRTIQDLHRAIEKHCPHGRRAGNPARPCKRCYRKAVTRSAEAVVMTYRAAALSADLMRAA
ncbi:GNAT family N-acetyltransferase [Streptomyces sp. NPDC008141]|uniref:GNAT family N-acetyltransferase n=1 Tax=Streptomyces sp. NPDC008141 TaxID=3364815 RepID=UPI0036EC1F49